MDPAPHAGKSYRPTGPELLGAEDMAEASAAGVVIAWIFSIWGSVDLLNAFYQANHAGQLGATSFIPILVVPLLLITPGLAFPILVQSEDLSAVQERGRGMRRGGGRRYPQRRCARERIRW